MKGIAPFVALGVAVVAVLVFLIGQAQVSPANLVAEISTTCPTGQVAKTILDKDKCGSEVTRTNEDIMGICTVASCPTEIVGEKVDRCFATVQRNSQDVAGTTVAVNPGETYQATDYCNRAKQGESGFFLKWEIWRERINQCVICVQDETVIPDECIPGQTRCSPTSATRVEVCSVPTTDKPYAHWSLFYFCDAGTCQEEGGIICRASCTNDAQCGRNEFCNSIGVCESKRWDTNECTDDSQCASGFCDTGLIGGNKCKTRPEETPIVITSCDSSQIKDRFTCEESCGGEWKSPGLFESGIPFCKLDPVGNFTQKVVGSFILTLFIALLVFIVSLWFPPLRILLTPKGVLAFGFIFVILVLL